MTGWGGSGGWRRIRGGPEAVGGVGVGGAVTERRKISAVWRSRAGHRGWVLSACGVLGRVSLWRIGWCWGFPRGSRSIRRVSFFGCLPNRGILSVLCLRGMLCGLWGSRRGRRFRGIPFRLRCGIPSQEVPHVRIGQSADLLVVAPATADILAKAAHGLASDLLTNTLLTARCPVVFAPAMHTEMWEHPATQANVATLRARGAIVIEPAVGRLTGADTGKGRLPDPAAIFEVCRNVLKGTTPDLAGRRVVVSAGGTREAIDPVRFIGNRSSGMQGYALARVAAARGRPSR